VIGAVSLLAAASAIGVPTFAPQELPLLPAQGVLVSDRSGVAFVDLRGNVLGRVAGLRFADENTFGAGVPRFKDSRGRLGASTARTGVSHLRRADSRSTAGRRSPCARDAYVAGARKGRAYSLAATSPIEPPRATLLRERGPRCDHGRSPSSGSEVWRVPPRPAALQRRQRASTPMDPPLRLTDIQCPHDRRNCRSGTTPGDRAAAGKVAGTGYRPGRPLGRRDALAEPPSVARAMVGRVRGAARVRRFARESNHPPCRRCVR
jgi:hypothetical protein